MSDIELIKLARTHGSSVAVRTGSAEHTYADLLFRSGQVALRLLGDDGEDLREVRVAYLMPAGFDYIAVQWGIWRAGGIAVPLSLSATESELEYTLTDSQAGYVVVTRELAQKLRGLCDRLAIPLLIVDEMSAQPAAQSLPALAAHRRAMILYTSGTTSKPKGVVSTHVNIQAQIETLVAAWSWQAADCIPLFLPLHHIHGIINVMSCALWAGATIEPFTHFDMQTMLRRVADGAYTVFMAVPTIYVKLIQELESLAAAEREPIVAGFGGMRLMVSGSAALPASVHDAWTALTGQKLLERYGMTEIGMGLSNPYDGERRPGAVGQPLPGVQVRLKMEKGEVVAGEGEPGEIQVRGPSVFLEYWNRPKVTAASFDDGWFCTGDMAIVEDRYYRIMGRQSVDIIKSGGYKLSALEIEAALLDHPAICECAVVGIADDLWGETVAVAAVLNSGCELDPETLRTWCAERLSKYKIPKKFLQVDSLPRNAMGKVTKPAVRDFF
ncbi:MAG: acyl-CoA synthetase [Deltaproteobacteria bacterium]|nr:acyl-CoA synthetase [Candidatus Anaeroferrophillus wilburensis]MBN2889972.1 acyl-CoA synthetase [Deltaproteobacteria bacterium]